MFKDIRSITYFVSDIEKAKEWYQKILKAKPGFDSPFAKTFRIGDHILVLAPKKNITSKNDNSTIVYWIVDNIDAAYKELLESGASTHSEIRPFAGSRMATVYDPFGNILGIVEPDITKKNMSVEEQPSETAHSVALMRAMAAVDEREEIRGRDYLAEIFVREDAKRSIEDQAAREWLLKNGMSGLYELMIARTAYIDNIVEQSLRENIPQIVFLGAGYDTRSYRFRDLIRDTRLFELDVQTTQKRKKGLLLQANISIPEQLTFISINFNTESINDVLLNAGYNKYQKTLFIWEGVTEYLTADSVDDTLNFIKSNSQIGSRLFFDYLTDTQTAQKVRENNRFSTSHRSEPYTFDIKEGKIESFLSERGFKLIEHVKPSDMEKRYLSLRDGSSIVNRNSGIESIMNYHCFVYTSTVN
jgi:methyltransferase (TIGR00027 family)